MLSATMCAPTAHVFNPSDWLTRFSSVGGAYALTGERLCIFIAPGEHDDVDLSNARQMIVDLSDEDRAGIVAHLQAADQPAPVLANDFASAVTAYRSAAAAYLDYRENVEAPASEAAERENSIVPHYETKGTFLDKWSGERRHMSTRNPHIELMAREVLADTIAADDFNECCRELVALADRRRAIAREIRAAHDIEAIKARGDELFRARKQAAYALAGHPVTCAAELIQKIELLNEDNGIHQCSLDTVLAGLRQIEGAAS